MGEIMGELPYRLIVVRKAGWNMWPWPFPTLAEAQARAKKLTGEVDVARWWIEVTVRVASSEDPGPDADWERGG